MSTYSLKIKVDKNQFPPLKDSGFKLCIAKKVNGVYTVVWQGDDFLSNNYYEWTEDYQLFGMNKFVIGELVEESTDPQDVEYGQTCTMDKYGLLNAATGPTDDSGKFHFQNNYGAIHVGVNAKLNGAFAPIFVSPTIVTGLADLAPSNTIKVFFDLHLKTGSMFFKEVTECIEIEYSDGVVAQTVGYEGDKPGVGAWTILPQGS